MKNLFATLLLVPLLALAAPAPKPTLPTEIAFTQGSGAAQVIRTLPILGRPNCLDFRGTPVNGPHGLERFRLICGNVAQGSFVQFNVDDGPVYPQWIYPAPPIACVPPTLPAPVVTPKDCAVTNPGTVGTWQQSAAYSLASPQVPPDGCYVLGAPLPAVAPPGACQAVPPPPGLVPAVNVAGDPMVPKPARGVTLQTRYGTDANRISDHAVDVPGVGMIREDYSRRQPVNADGTRLLAGYNDEYWYVYDISDPVHARFLTQLVGPVGDAELQWSATDPNVLYYLPINGGTVLKSVDIRTNASTVVYDFTADVTALWPSARRAWTKSEGSPSADGRYWGLMVETDGFAPLGFVVLDIVAKRITWHANNSVRPDHVSMTPSGRWFEVSGDDARGTVVYGVVDSNLGQTKQLHHKSEHSDIGYCGNFDFYASVDYQTNLGDVFWESLEDNTVQKIEHPAGAHFQTSALGNAKRSGKMVTTTAPSTVSAITRHVVGYVYGHPNPWFNTNYAIHVSAKAFGKCSFLSSNYGTPPANVVLWDMTAPANMPYGVGENYALIGNYFDEVQAALARDGKSFFYNDNFGGPSLSGDVYRGTMPQ